MTHRIGYQANTFCGGRLRPGAEFRGGPNEALKWAERLWGDSYRAVRKPGPGPAESFFYFHGSECVYAIAEDPRPPEPDTPGADPVPWIPSNA